MIRKVIYRAIVMVAAVVSLGSCARVQEACGVVAEADSLRAVGQAFTDSVAIADAAETLYPVRLFYSTDYAHANYYYGRLLREHGNHPAAMEAFLRTVHSRTRDHAIKGRAYSNMGTLCDLAGEYELAYDIYHICSEELRLAKDTTMYYYSLNAMALQLAKQGLYDETLSVLACIAKECTNSDVISKTFETKAFLYVQSEKYEDAILSIDSIQRNGYNAPSGLTKKAQAFWYLQQYDSALYYANYVSSMPNASARDCYNMLYILAYNDSAISHDEFRKLTEERSDIDKEILDPLAEKLITATEVLKQDLNRKPDLRWLYAIIGTLSVIAIIILLYIKHKRHQHRLISQQIEKAVNENNALSEQHQQLEQQQAKRKTEILHEIEMYCQSLQNSPNIKKELCWNDYDAMCAIVNRRMFGLAEKLKSLKSLNEREIRLCVLVVIGNFRDKEMAEILCYGENSIRTIKSIASKKLGTTGRNLRSFLLETAVLG